MQPLSIKKTVDDLAVEPITVAEAKNFLRITSFSDDDYIQGVISASRQSIEKSTRRSMVKQSQQLGYDHFPILSNKFIIPNPPISQIDSVKYYDVNNVLHTLDATDYVLDNSGTGAAHLGLTDDFSTPTLSSDYKTPVLVTVSTEAYKLDAALKQAMLLLVGNFYEMRIPVSVGGVPFKMPLSLEHLISQYKVSIQI